MFVLRRTLKQNDNEKSEENDSRERQMCFYLQSRLLFKKRLRNGCR